MLRSQTTGRGTTSNIRKFSFTVKPKSAYVPKYGSMIANHMQVSLEQNNTSYNREARTQAYRSPKGELLGGNYGFQTIGTTRPCGC